MVLVAVLADVGDVLLVFDDRELNGEGNVAGLKGLADLGDSGAG